MTQFYTTIKLGDKQAFTPEGFLVVYDVPIARTGEQMYAVEEFLSQGAKLDAAEDGFVHVDRPAEEVFRPETLASANGKPIIDEHPKNWANITPENWRNKAHGSVLSPRRGTGEWSDTILADFVIYDKYAINLVRSNDKREVSCGYSSDYRREGPGRYVQSNILINHVALVREARCGARCSIGDNQRQLTTHDHCGCSGKGATMKIKFKDAVTKVLELVNGTGKEAEIRQTLEAVQVRDAEESAENGGGGIHIHAGGGSEGRTKYTDEALDTQFSKNEERHTAHDSKFAAHDNDIAEMKKKLGMGDSGETAEIEGAIKEEAPVGTGDGLVRARDSVGMRDMYQRTLSAAEVLVPGITLRAFDSSATPTDAYKSICDSRRKVLQFAMHDSALRVLMEEVRGGAPFTEQAIAGLRCAQVRDTFFALAAAKRKANNGAAAVAGGVVNGNGGQNNGGVRNTADLNKRNAEFYKNH